MGERVNPLGNNPLSKIEKKLFKTMSVKEIFGTEEDLTEKLVGKKEKNKEE